MDDQLGLLLIRERLRQNDRCGRFRSPLEELSNLSSSWKIFHIVIVTIDKAKVSGFALILIISRLGFGFLRPWVIFFLLILTLPFFRFILSGRGSLNRVNLSSFAGGRSRRRSILNIRIIELGFGGRGFLILRLSMESSNHTVSRMRRSRGSLSSSSKRERCIRE
jgi:hypothetical protein